MVVIRKKLEGCSAILDETMSSSLSSSGWVEMESLGVLLIVPINPYLEAELDRRFKLFRLWDSPPARRREFLQGNAPSIRAVVGSTAAGADAEMIDLLPRLDIVANFGVGIDKVDLARCRDRRIRVVYTPDVVTDDTADLAIGLAIAAMRRICDADLYVRTGSWKHKGDNKLTFKVRRFPSRGHTEFRFCRFLYYNVLLSENRCYFEDKWPGYCNLNLQIIHYRVHEV